MANVEWDTRKGFVKGFCKGFLLRVFVIKVKKTPISPRSPKFKKLQLHQVTEITNEINSIDEIYGAKHPFCLFKVITQMVYDG